MKKFEIANLQINNGKMFKYGLDFDFVNNFLNTNNKNMLLN